MTKLQLRDLRDSKMGAAHGDWRNFGALLGNEIACFQFLLRPLKSSHSSKISHSSIRHRNFQRYTKLLTIISWLGAAR